MAKTPKVKSKKRTQQNVVPIYYLAKNIMLPIIFDIPQQILNHLIR